MLKKFKLESRASLVSQLEDMCVTLGQKYLSTVCLYSEILKATEIKNSRLTHLMEKKIMSTQYLGSGMGTVGCFCQICSEDSEKADLSD